jgi:hypothetical protein
MTGNRLPDGFQELDVYVDEWALDNEKDRYLKLHKSTIEDIRALYDAVFVRIDDIIDRLNQTPLAAFSQQERTLMNLAMTFAETAHPIDLNWKDVDFNEAFTWEKFGFQGVSLEPMKETA